MRFRRALAALAFSMAAPAVASAQSARQVDIAYEITFAGLSGFRIDLTAKFNGPNYDIESRTFKEGVLRAVTMHYDGRNRAWGGFSAQGMSPSAGSLSIVVGDKPRTWVVQYGGNTLQETHTPAYKPSPQNAISEEQRRGSLDPLSAALSVGMAGDAACDRTVQSNDGKRLIDIIIKKVGTESAAKAGIPGAQGDVLVCEIFTRRVAGEFDGGDRARTADARVAGAHGPEPDALSRQAGSADRLRHDPRPDPRLPRTPAHAGRKPGDAEVDSHNLILRSGRRPRLEGWATGGVRAPMLRDGCPAASSA